MTTSEIRGAVYRQLLRHRHEVFQSFQLREELGWQEDAPEARTMHAIIQELKRVGIVGQTGTSRKRNQYLMLEKPDELQMRLGRLRTKAPSQNGDTPSAASANRPAPQRIILLEEQVSEMDERLAEIVKTLQDIHLKMADLDELRIKVDDIHRSWFA